MRWLHLPARLCALLAGILLCLIAIVTCASVVGRNGLGASFIGDFELTGVLSGVAIANFMPWCQLQRGNIIVDFFTTRAAARTRANLDRFGALVISLMMALLAWRTVVGAFIAWGNHSSSMLLGFPDWLVFLGMVPPLVLAALIALVQALSPDSATVSDKGCPA